MLEFKFDISYIEEDVQPVREERPRYKVIKDECKGIILYNAGIFKVLYSQHLYPVTNDSLRTKGKRSIYAIRRDEYGHRVNLIRSVGYRVEMPAHCYSALADGLICIGKLVEDKYDTVLFQVSKCINPMQITDDMDETLRVLNKIKYDRKWLKF